MYIKQVLDFRVYLIGFLNRILASFIKCGDSADCCEILVFLTDPQKLHFVCGCEQVTQNSSVCVCAPTELYRLRSAISEIRSDVTQRPCLVRVYMNIAPGL